MKAITSLIITIALQVSGLSSYGEVGSVLAIICQSLLREDGHIYCVLNANSLTYNVPNLHIYYPFFKF